jgi:uncharacterized membrane protein
VYDGGLVRVFPYAVITGHVAWCVGHVMWYDVPGNVALAHQHLYYETHLQTSRFAVAQW